MIARLLCWFGMHRWESVDDRCHRIAVLGHLHTWAGAQTACVRCGHPGWDDRCDDCKAKRPAHRAWARALASIWVVLLLLAAPARADDYPVLEQGAPAPVRGLLVPESKALELAQRIKGCEAELAVYKESPPPMPMGPVIAVGLGALVVGAIVGGVVVAFAVKK